MKINKITTVILLLVLLLLIGCQDSTIIEDPVICNQPYMRLGTTCCLDLNENNICDDDEQEPTPSCTSNDDCEDNEACFQGAGDGGCKLLDCPTGSLTKNHECEELFEIPF